jgi:hypothetical protein
LLVHQLGTRRSGSSLHVSEHLLGIYGGQSLVWQPKTNFAASVELTLHLDHPVGQARCSRRVLRL